MDRYCIALCGKNVMQSITKTIIAKCCQYDYQVQPLTVQNAVTTAPSKLVRIMGLLLISIRDLSFRKWKCKKWRQFLENIKTNFCIKINIYKNLRYSVRNFNKLKHICQLTASSWNMAKFTAAFGVWNTVVAERERRCQRHKDGPPPHTWKQHSWLHQTTVYQ